MLSLRFCNITATQILRRAIVGNGCAVRSSSSSNMAAVATATMTASTGTSQSSTSTEKQKKPAGPAEGDNLKKQKHSLVAAAFENLKNEDPSPVSKTPSNASAASSSIDERILNAKTVNSLLAITEGNVTLNRKHALKIVSILAEWSTINRANVSEFENDSRFLKVCRLLGRTVSKNENNAENGGASNNNNSKRITGYRTDDLNTVLGVAGDDEAAKLIASISLPQMVKVMSALALRKRRSTPLLRSLAFNISSSSEQLDLKQCADIFYAMACLNFQDSVLAAKVCADIQLALPQNKDKSAVIGSILTSLGIMKHRDLDILESLTQWTLQHSDICRPQDISALFLTSAILNFKSTRIDEVREKLTKSIVQQDFAKNIDWLNQVWSLSMLGICEPEHLDSVLNNAFVEKMKADKLGLSATSKMKLLNLNSYAQLVTKDYKGSLLTPDSLVYDVPMAHTKEKQIILNGLLDALKSLLPAKNHVKTLEDSKMGFLIDAICVFDAKRNPLPLDKEHKDAIKVALMVVDYHDVCHGTHRSASGITTLSFDLLEKSGYKVISIPYNEFSTSDKLLKRVQYLENKFKALISSQ